MFNRQNHVMWVIAQQIGVRGVTAFKFLFAARLLGPEQIGLVGIATLALAVIESLLDTGLPHAVIQRASKIKKHEAGAVWTLQLFRGAVLALILCLIAGPFSLMLNAPTATSLVLLAAVIPLVRNGFNPGVFLVVRERNFQNVFIFEASAALVDLGATLMLIYLGFESGAILLGIIAGDSLKLALTWTWLKTPIAPNFQWRIIKSLTCFGKWIWGSSVVTLVLNQIDKAVVARYLGSTELGLYQMASRIAQLTVSDGAVALGQYLYPTFAQRHRESAENSYKYFMWILSRWLPLAASAAIVLVSLSGVLVDVVLGEEWAAATPLLQAMALPMFIGAVIAILVAYLRGTGEPRAVTEATLVQLILLVIFAPILLNYFSVMGMIMSLAIAGFGAAGFMFVKVVKRAFATA